MKLLSRFAVLMLAVLCVGVSEAAPKAGVVNRIAATVNGRPITSSEVRARLAPYFRELMMLYPRQGPRFNSELVAAKKAVLNDLIERELVLSDFETKGFSIKEDQVEDEINRRILMQYNGDRSEFLDNLRKSGMNYTEYRESVRKEITVSAMRGMRYERGIPPTPDEIKEEYKETSSEYRDIMKDRITYSKIFIPAMDPDDPMMSPEERYKLAVRLREEIEAGKISFADAARKYSRDAHAEDGGRWPTLRRDDLAVEFANVVFAAKPGQLVGPLADPAGFTIVKVQGKKLAAAPSLENPEVKQKVDDAVRRKKSERRYRQWVDRLRDKAVIRTFI
ncbi:MAG: SurA N-terminal domain-containing protein [Akkermansia sp.]|nr:SurA N-terminal domain-containing protein [Akkermansia sp.]MBQ8376371.1 SurA N-terminal domain-containing protein [Akkermansia sp.]